MMQYTTIGKDFENQWNALIARKEKEERKTTHKYIIEIPKYREEAFRFDRNNGNTFWSDALQKKMTNVGIAFEILDKDNPVPVGWKGQPDILSGM